MAIAEPGTAAPQEHPATAPLVLSVGARSPTERRLVARWAQDEHPDAVLRAHDDPDVATLVEEDPHRLVVPIRVTWLPPETDSGRNPGDVIALMNPRRPKAALQPLALRAGSARVQVIAGEPADGAELRDRFRRESGVSGAAAFSAFVARQAVVASDRAARAVLGERHKVPRLVAEQIVASARYRERIERLAQDLDRDPAELLGEGEAALRELATAQSPLGIDAYRRFVSPMHANAWTVQADPDGIERIRELGRRHALVFLPTHRSYVDTLVLQDALQANDLPRNHVIGGANLSFWPLGPLGRRAGVVWIRRRFGSDQVYKLSLREYLGHLVAKRFNLEWYLEGGRTRTGKLRPPKIGMLRYLTDALEDDRDDDVALVPVSIVYDRLQEVRELAAEQSGGTKQAEGLKWWVDYVRSQRSNVGKARVHFGEPFLLREALGEFAEDENRLQKIAFRVCDRINAVTPVTPTSLVTFTLLGSRDQALSMEQVQRLTEPLVAYLEQTGAPGPLAELRRATGLRRALDQLVAAGAVEVHDRGLEPVWRITPGRHHVAAFYRNGSVHHFLLRAIAELALLCCRADGDRDHVATHVHERALALRDALKFEFFFADKAVFAQQVEAELERFAPDWRERVAQADGASDLLRDASPLVAHRTLRSFFDAQLVVAGRLAARNPREAVEREAFLQECADVGTQMLLQGELHGGEAVGLELFGAALDLAANRDLVDPGRDEVQAARAAWLAEVQDTLADLEIVQQADDTAIEELLRGDAG